MGSGISIGTISSLSKRTGGHPLSNSRKYDLSYVTVDSISEGVGSSQILPLMQRLANLGLSIQLISFEKTEPSQERQNAVRDTGISWNKRIFKTHGALGGLSRLIEISREIPNAKVIHARSDIPAVAAAFSRKAPILWDVRSLWADQKAFIEQDPIKRKILKAYGLLEGIASFNASAMSTLTHAIVPVLEERHRRVPQLRIVVPTAVDLARFQLNSKIPVPIKGLYSGTYNNYYDLKLSKRFVDALREMAPVDVHWARPKESPQNSLEAGETKTFAATQIEMANILSEYSFGLSICKLDAGPSLKAAMPTKVAEFLACGRPMVVNAGLGDFDEYIREFDAGIILNGANEDLKLNAEKLIELMNDPETPQRCRALAEKYFDIDKGAEKYFDLYTKI